MHQMRKKTTTGRGNWQIKLYIGEIPTYVQLEMEALSKTKKSKTEK